MALGARLSCSSSFPEQIPPSHPLAEHWCSSSFERGTCSSGSSRDTRPCPCWRREDWQRSFFYPSDSCTTNLWLGRGLFLPSNFTILLPHAGHRHCSSQPASAPGRIRLPQFLSGFSFSWVLWGEQRGSSGSAYPRTPPPPPPPPPGSAGRRLSMAPSPMLAPPVTSPGTGAHSGQCRGALLSRRR